MKRVIDATLACSFDWVALSVIGILLYSFGCELMTGYYQGNLKQIANTMQRELDVIQPFK